MLESVGFTVLFFYVHIVIVFRFFRYELYDPCTVMFFFRNKHIMIDLGTGNNNKSTSCAWANVNIEPPVLVFRVFASSIAYIDSI